MALTQHEDMVIDCFELLCNRGYENLVQQVCEDMGAVSPETQVVPRTIALE